MATSIARRATPRSVRVTPLRAMDLWREIETSQEQHDRVRQPGTSREFGCVPTPFPIAAAMAARLLRGVVPGERVLRLLDAGCGSGRLLSASVRQAATQGLSLAAHGIEIDATTARFARTLAPRLRAAAGTAVCSWHVQNADFLANRTAESSYDLIISNPPWVPLRALDSDTRLRLRAQGLTATGDLAACFVARMLSALRPGGRLCVIVPNKLLASDYAAPLRRALFEQTCVEEVWDLSQAGVFDCAAYPVVLVAKRSTLGRRQDVLLTGGDDTVRASWPQEALRRLPGAVVPLGLDPRLGSMLGRLGACGSLGEQVVIRCGIAVAGFAKGIGSGPEKILTTGDIEPFRIRRRQPFDLGRAGVAARNVRAQRADKIVIPGMFRSLYAAIDRQATLLGRVYWVSLDGSAAAQRERAASLLGLFNSRLYDVLYRGLFQAVAQSGGYLRLNTPYLAALPWPLAAPPAGLRGAVEALLRAPAGSRARLDALVEHWFGLGPDEVAALGRGHAWMRSRLPAARGVSSPGCGGGATGASGRA